MRMIGVFVLAAALAPAFGQQPVLKLDMRSRVEAFKGSGAWQEVRVQGSLPVRETAFGPDADRVAYAHGIAHTHAIAHTVAFAHAHTVGHADPGARLDQRPGVHGQ